MIRKLLIANRGEVAARIIATARRMGIAAVAVHSDADAGALHVAMADEAVRIGLAPAAQSYLDGSAIIAAARATGAEAIHPGYGFLSENPEFAEAVETAGLRFVGPPATAIRAMGLKDAAKTLMEKAGVPVVPGYHGARQEPDFLAGCAEEIGYPVLIKARAGGGGKGMRRVERAADFADALAAAQREGQASFGDPRVLIEKFIETPRHIEIQVFADSRGNVIHLFERDCSLQRRHQKVIEEAPAPGMTAEVRAVMGAAAVEAARAIGYVGAGTVEFIADGSGPLRPDGFWFMEMNTRLQVEHPVTEAITGLDLVEWQLRVAAGEPLPLSQDALRIEGHAVEARLYAEDAAAGFLPATGRLDLLSFPQAEAFARGALRIDAGVQQGDWITPHYDPMLAKVIAHGPDRGCAFAKLAEALEHTRVAGTVTNVGFLARLARHPAVLRGEVDTGLIAREADALTTPSAAGAELAEMAACLAALGLPRSGAGADPWDALSGWRAWGSASHGVSLLSGDREISAGIRLLGDAEFEIGGARIRAEPSPGGVRLTRDGHSERVDLHESGSEITVFCQGESFVFIRPDPLSRATQRAAGEDVVRAPMPGQVTQVMVASGAKVSEGAPLLVLEAMKMEHVLRAPRAGTIAEVSAVPGVQVENGTLLIRLTEEPDG